MPKKDDHTAYYPMGRGDDPKRKRGRCLILNYCNYQPKEGESDRTRHGTEHDCRALEQTFTKLNYQVLVHHNLTKAGTDLVLKTIEKETINHRDYCSFILCILAHGEENQFDCVDNQPYNYRDIYKLFDECESLRGKPKLYFIQACQGKNVNSGHETLEPDQTGPTFTTYKMVSREDTKLIPKMSDYLWFVCCEAGDFSMRSSSRGSWFIQELCKEFDTNSNKKMLHSMLHSVSNRVSQYTAEREIKYLDGSKEDEVDQVKQSPGYMNKLRFDVKFY